MGPIIGVRLPLSLSSSLFFSFSYSAPARVRWREEAVPGVVATAVPTSGNAKREGVMAASGTAAPAVGEI
jgi:hypothetical protein